ncbi:MAG TPA: AAA family ATPase [Mycobacterium sp.]|nr:AAA family ATPase [Mycobacterium sp.]
MLSEIRIESVREIGTAFAEFDRGFTVLTGETGTGKTMVVTGLHPRVDAFAVVDAVGGTSLVRVTLHEGRKRIVRRLLAAVGYPVQSLVGAEIGAVSLGNQRPGSIWPVDRNEIGELYKAVGL